EHTPLIPSQEGNKKSGLEKRISPRVGGFLSAVLYFIGFTSKDVIGSKLINIKHCGNNDL
ncbi:MAG TPA: hypothetical protein PKY56_06290, partial [Candidatus Kapabacteria bacterium]|nr:hypothetical protein [Candidatus Kapabacteria bacterium]